MLLLKYQNNDSEKNDINLDLRPIKLNDNNLIEISRLIRISWSNDYSDHGFILHNPKQLKWLLSSPNKDQNLILGSYNNSTELVGFNAVMPMMLKINSREYKAGISTFLSVHPQYRGKKVAQKMLMTTFNNMAKGEYDCCLAYFDLLPNYQGGKPVYFSMKKFKLKKLFKSNWLARILDVSKFIEKVGLDVPIKQILGSNDSICINPELNVDFTPLKYLKKITNKSLKYFDKLSLQDKKSEHIQIIINQKDINSDLIIQLTDLLNTIPKSNNKLFTRHWTQPELIWYINGNSSRIILYKNSKNKIIGVIFYLIQNIQSKKTTKFGWIDYYIVDDLTLKQKRELISYALILAKSEGAISMVIPKTLNTNTTALKQCGFIPYTRKFETYLVQISDKCKTIKLSKKFDYRVEVH